MLELRGSRRGEGARNRRCGQWRVSWPRAFDREHPQSDFATRRSKENDPGGAHLPAAVQETHRQFYLARQVPEFVATSRLDSGRRRQRSLAPAQTNRAGLRIALGTSDASNAGPCWKSVLELVECC